MRTIEVNLFKFDELSEQAKQVAISNYRNGITEIFWSSENRNSMEKFAEVFPIKVKDWQYDYGGGYVRFVFDCDYEDEIENLSGQRLANYIWNNYKTDFWKGKYYNSWASEKIISHKKVKSTLMCKENGWSNTENYGKYWNVYSGLNLTDTDCPLTGYSMDCDLLYNIYDFCKKPDNRTFRELLEDCFSAWVKSCVADIEYQGSDEFITEQLIANDYEFTEDGIEA